MNKIGIENALGQPSAEQWRARERGRLAVWNQRCAFAGSPV